MALDQLHTTKAETRYWFTEWDPSAYGMVQHMEFEDIWAKLYDEAKTGWSDKARTIMRASRKRTAILKSYGKWKMSGGFKTANNEFPAARMFGGFAPSCEAKAPLRQELHPLTF